MPPRKVVIVTVSGLGLLIAVLGLLWASKLRGPLAGETVHDFGTISVAPGQTLDLEHTFHLTNRLSTPLSVLAIRPDCGCVRVGEFSRTVEPGGKWNLPITMRFAGHSRTVLIHLDMGEAGLQALKVITSAGDAPPRAESASEISRAKPAQLPTPEALRESSAEPVPHDR